jgi:beta-phosphoglucomutase-like phosphatase (HAD superfamily)
LQSKPSPEGYLKAARVLRAAPEAAIVFEDAEAGLNAGRAAGAQVIGIGAVRQNHGLADQWIEDYTALSFQRTSTNLLIDIAT